MIKDTKFPGQGPVRIEGTNFNDYVFDKDAAFAVARDNLDIVADVAEREVTQRDITAFAYRKRQLEHFKKLLEDDAFFKTQKSTAKAETVWQNFFERNHWIFGYGLSYIFTTALSDRKLEQVVAGASVKDAGKRVDGLLKTQGRIKGDAGRHIETLKGDVSDLAVIDIKQRLHLLFTGWRRVNNDFSIDFDQSAFFLGIQDIV